MKMGDDPWPTQQPNESDKDFYRRVFAWLHGETVRSKGDNREWTGSPPFHLNREST